MPHAEVAALHCYKMTAPRHCATATLALLLLLPLTSSVAPATGNFGISTPSCFLEDGPLINPPILSTYLAEVARGSLLELSLDGQAPVPLSRVFAAAEAPVFPLCAYSAALGGGLSVSWSLLAPLSPAHAEWAFLPVLLGTLSLRLGEDAPPFSRNATLRFRLACGSDEASQRACGSAQAGGGGEYSWLEGGGAVNATPGGLFVGAQGGLAAGADCGSAAAAPGSASPALCASLTLEVRPTARAAAGRLCLGYHAAAGRYAPAHPTPARLAAHALEHASALAAHHAAFLAALPLLARAEDSAAVRWWLQSPLLLTKGVQRSVLTMGYVELNQRDSFWTSMLHAHLWPALESEMLQESCEQACTEGGGPPSYCQRDAAGKIPTCILPTIVRDDNVDITAFFALRLGRHFAATGNETLLRALYPCLRSALHYLQRRCPPGTALPAAREDSYWGSWLDVPFMRGRRLMADNSAVYLAAQRVGAQSARLLAARAEAEEARRGAPGWGGLRNKQPGAAAAGSAAALRQDAANFSAAFVAGLGQLLRPVEEGGQWESARTGGSLVDTWHDGTRSNYSLGDQFMAVFFGLLDGRRAGTLLRWMTAGGGGGGGGRQRERPGGRVWRARALPLPAPCH